MNSGDGRKHVLFVDEEPAIQRRVAQFLRAPAADLRLTCASNGAEALHVLDRGRVDLLITSLAIPVIDGVELLRHLINHRATLPVLVVTEHAPPDEAGARAGDRVELLREPITAEPLLERVQALLAEPAGTRRGVSLVDLLHVLRMERRTCALRVSAAAGQGTLYFMAGALIDAHLAEHRGTSAALEILGWPAPTVALDPKVRARSATIFATLGELLGELERRGGAERLPRRELEREGGAPRGVAAGGDAPARATTRPAVTRAPHLSLVPPAPPVPAPLVEAAAVGGALGPAPARAEAVWERAAAQATISRVVAEALEIDGARTAALANWELDHSLGLRGDDEPRRIEAAVTGHCRVMRAMATVMTRLGMRTSLRDLVITSSDGLLDVLAPLRGDDGLFLWVAIDPRRGSLALARRRVRNIVSELLL